MTNSCGLYRSEFEHDACGVGFIAHIKGQKSHSIVSQALDVLKNLRHRGAVGADPLQGDGAGILIQIPDQLYRDDMMNQGREAPARRRIWRRHGFSSAGGGFTSCLRRGN